ncbi:MAG: hypothetical protein ACM3ML_25020, partial [Micromonosporaceae bacterium]
MDLRDAADALGVHYQTAYAWVRQAIASGEETAARHQVERLAAGVPVADRCEHVIAPAIRERLIAAHARQPARRPHGTAVVAAPPGERHSMPSLMAAVCLREDRWLVHHLAADLPFEEVTSLADQAGASLVVLSPATTQTARQAQQAARVITATRPHLNMLAGRPGDQLHDLLARAANRKRPAGTSTPEEENSKKKETSRGPLPGDRTVAAPTH